MPVPRFVMKAAGQGSFVVAEANRRAVAYFGHTYEDTVGQSFDNLVATEDTRYFMESLDVAVRQKKPVTVKAPPGIPGGTRFGGFYINPIVDDKSGDVKFLDIIAIPASSDAQSLQRERDDAISLLTSVFDVSEVGIVVTDHHHRIIRVNESFVRIYGWPRDEVIGRDFKDFVTPDEREIAQKNHEDFNRSGVRNSGEMKLIRKSGEIANILFTTAALELSHGRKFQITTIMDISLRKQMEINLRVAKEQADTANQAKSTFLANMSHELRTPLNAILGFSEMMIKETFGVLGNPKYKEYLGDIHLSARHLLEIINEVLDMSKIEAGRTQLDEEYFDLGQLADSVTRMMASRAFSAGLEISVDIPLHQPPLYADPRLVRQILINLVGNAVKYSNEGGKIHLKTNMTQDGNLQLIVSDTGIGIPKERIHEALEPFGQINRAADSRGGTGLGLPLAKAMVELHSGSLTLDSDVGKGTTVTVTFPAQRVGIQERASPLKRKANSGVAEKA